MVVIRIGLWAALPCGVRSRFCKRGILTIPKKTTPILPSKICLSQNGDNPYFWSAILLQNEIRERLLDISPIRARLGFDERLPL
jgi:hypothetical protein